MTPDLSHALFAALGFALGVWLMSRFAHSDIADARENLESVVDLATNLKADLRRAEQENQYLKAQVAAMEHEP